MARSAYKAKISMSFIKDNKETSIDSNFIKYIMIENLYDQRYMPVIYVSLAVTNDIYTDIIQNEKSAKMYLAVQKYNIYSNTSLYKDDIKGQFTYIVSTSNPNYSEDLSTNDPTLDTAYKKVTVALMSMEIMNLSKTSFNGIFGNIDENTVILKMTDGLNAVIKKPLYNPTFDTLFIPPMPSKTKLLEYMYQKCPFYDTNYIFFIDFHRSYLIDLTGEACPANDGSLNSIFINIQGATADSSYYEGIETSDNAYILYVNPANTNVTVNKSSDKISNQLVFVDDNGSVDYVDLNVNNNTDSNVKQSFKRGGNANLYKNMAESNTVVIELVKENIDASIITPNKEFRINNYPGYEDYNGKYTLLYKKEIIKNVNGEFGLSVCIGLRKVGNITALGASVAVQATQKSKSAYGKYSTASNTKTKTTTATSKTVSSTTKSTSTSKKSSTTNEYTQKKPKVLPTVIRLKASDSNVYGLKRKPRKISGED